MPLILTQYAMHTAYLHNSSIRYTRLVILRLVEVNRTVASLIKTERWLGLLYYALPGLAWNPRKVHWNYIQQNQTLIFVENNPNPENSNIVWQWISKLFQIRLIMHVLILFNLHNNLPNWKRGRVKWSRMVLACILCRKPLVNYVTPKRINWAKAGITNQFPSFHEQCQHKNYQVVSSTCGHLFHKHCLKSFFTTNSR